MPNIKVYLRTDLHGAENVLHAAGGSPTAPLNISDISIAASLQLGEDDYKIWRTSPQRLLRYDTYEADPDFETYGEDD